MAPSIISYLTVIALLVATFDLGSSRNLKSEFYQLLRDKRSEITLKQAYLQLSDEHRESNYIHKRSEPGKCNKRSKETITGPNTRELEVRFPSVHVDTDDSYLVTAHEIPFQGKESYIVKFTPHANMAQTHHMLVYGCSGLPSSQPYWNGGGRVCDGKIVIYAWARNAPELVLPDNVGVRIGGNSNIKYIAIQMHFAAAFAPGLESCAGVTLHTTTIPQKYYAGIFLLGSSSFQLKPHTENDVAPVNCQNPLSSKITVFGFRTHAHSLAKVITGYRIRSGEYHMIGKGNPQWPQSFYPRVGGNIDIMPGDWFAGSCVYDNPTTRNIYAGPSSTDEMCNFYMMFYTENKDVLRQTLSCWNVPYLFSGQTLQLPQSSLTLAPYPGYGGEDSTKAVAAGTAVAPEVPEEHVHGGHHHEDKEEEVHQSHDEDVDKKDKPTQAVAAVLQQGPESDEEQGQQKNLSRGHGMPETEGLYIDNSWLHIDPPYEIGSVGGLVADKYGNIHVFHRAGRIWDEYSFDYNNRFLLHDPIKPETVYKIDNVTGKVVNAWGAGMFYMPHGISLDKDGNMWLTDVGLHQVLKFSPEGATEPLITLGQRMVPGSDVNHFCKPADVAIDDQGLVYVADGYCNGRVMKFDQTGKFIKSWGRVGTILDNFQNPMPHSVFSVVHNIVMCGPTLSDVCVADRENGRIQIFDKEGNFLRIFEDKKKIGQRLFAIAYSPSEGGLIYGVNGPGSPRLPVLGFTIRYSSGNVIDTWEPGPGKTLTDPHDITATCDGRRIFVGQLSGEKVYKFNYASSLPSNKSHEPITSMPEKVKKIKKQSREEVVQPVEHKETSDILLPEEKHVDKDVGQSKEQVDEIVEGKGMHMEDNTSTIIIAILVALPIVAILTAFICIRMRAKRLKEYQGLLSNEKPSKGSSLNLGNFLQRSKISKKGFTMVQGVPSDEEDAEGSDSDVEVYSKNSRIENNHQPRF